MRKRLGAALAVVVAGVVVLPAVASAEPTGLRPPYGPPPQAAGPSSGECPHGAGWVLVTPSGPQHLSAAYDFNGDGEVCVRFPAGGGIAFMDNVIPSS